MITYEEVSRLFNYDENTGVLTWKISPARRVKVGDIAGSPLHNKYLQVFIHNKGYRVHRIVWLLKYKELPNGFIDHIDHDGFNNRISNLRVVTVEENNKNITMPKNNTSGVIGVSYNKKLGKWYAQIRSNRIHYYLGSFNTFEEAVQARREAEVKYGFHKNHGKKKIIVRALSTRMVNL